MENLFKKIYYKNKEKLNNEIDLEKDIYLKSNYLKHSFRGDLITFYYKKAYIDEQIFEIDVKELIPKNYIELYTNMLKELGEDSPNILNEDTKILFKTVFLNQKYECNPEMILKNILILENTYTKNLHLNENAKYEGKMVYLEFNSFNLKRKIEDYFNLLIHKKYKEKFDFKIYFNESENITPENINSNFSVYAKLKEFKNKNFFSGKQSYDFPSIEVNYIDKILTPKEKQENYYQNWTEKDKSKKFYLDKNCTIEFTKELFDEYEKYLLSELNSIKLPIKKSLKR